MVSTTCQFRPNLATFSHMYTFFHVLDIRMLHEKSEDTQLEQIPLWIIVQLLRSPILDPFWSSMIIWVFNRHRRRRCQVLIKSFYTAIDALSDFIRYCISPRCHLFPVKAIKPGMFFHSFSTTGSKATIFIYHK